MQASAQAKRDDLSGIEAEIRRAEDKIFAAFSKYAPAEWRCASCEGGQTVFGAGADTVVYGVCGAARSMGVDNPREFAEARLKQAQEAAQKRANLVTHISRVRNQYVDTPLPSARAGEGHGLV